ncbi:MAG: dipeptidase, partial [Sphingopyxis sp.]
CVPASAPEATTAASDSATLHERLLTLDTHIDTPLHFERAGWRFAEAHSFANDLSHVDLPRMHDGGLDGGFFVVYTGQGPLTTEGYTAAATHAQRRLVAIERTFAANARAITLVTSAAQAEAAVRSGRHAGFISIENSYPLGESVAALADYRRRGVLMAGPVHNGGNQFGDSASGGTARWGGLSPLGRQWVAEMNRLGMIIDASHSSDAALAQMLELSTAPIVLSHSGLDRIFDHPRNISDDQLRALAAKGGVLQINSVFLSRFNNSAARSPLYDQFDRIGELSAAEVATLAAQWATLDRTERVNEGDFALFMRALLHCLEVAGADHCGIGADWDGGGGLRGFEDVTALPQITASLARAGYNEGDIAKIWGGNVLRLLRAAEAARQRN